MASPDHMPLIGRRVRIAIKCLLLYGITWIASQFVWYQFTIEDELTQVDHATVAGLDVGVWTGSSNRSCSRAIWCPFVETCTTIPPIGGIGIRLVDPSRHASRAVFHSALLRCADGTSTPLFLVAERGDPPGTPAPFFQNASEWIVHVTHRVASIAGPAEIDLDVSVTILETVVRERVTVHIVPAVKRSSGWVFASA